jgi:hypothetical protein
VHNYSSGIVGASLVAGIAIAWAAMLLPAHGTTTAPGGAQILLRTTSNAALKGDRFSSARLKRSSAVKVWKAPPTSKGTAKIPIGCDPAFSGIVRYGNFAARCVT